MSELISIHARSMIETLLHVHALANMYRVSGDEEYRKTAAGWLPNLESLMSTLKREMTKEGQPREETHNGR